MQIRPLNDWAVIVPSEAAERTAGGLYIPDAAREKPAEGVVESIGPGALEEEKWGKKKEKDKKKERKFIPTTVKPGERVLYERYGGTKITVSGREVVLVRERSILGIFAGGSSSADPKPLLLPARTATSGETSLATLALSAITAKASARPAAAKAPSGGKKPAPGNKKKAAPGKKKAAVQAAGRPKKAAAKKTVKKKAKKKR